MSYYGVIFPEFWTGSTGLELRARGGKDAQILALYLATNRHANMLGLYHLMAVDMKHETGLSVKAIERSLGVIAETAFAAFDAATSFVWVRQMARFKLGLHPGETLQPADNRVVAANRLYQHLGVNPFLGPFYDANRKLLCLRKRREVDMSLVVSRAYNHQMSSLQGASKGLPSQDQDQDQDQGSVTGIRDQGSATVRAGAPPAPPVPNGARPHVRGDQAHRRRVAADAGAARRASAPVDEAMVKKHFG